MVSGEPAASGAVPGGAGGMLAGFAAGTRLAGYRLEEQVGAGGMAMVFRAVDERLDRLVALKVLAPAVASDEGFRQRFIRESRAAAAIDDPHIIPVHEAGQAGGVLFIAMRYVPGGDVRGLLRRGGPLPPERVAAIISPVASALDAAHAIGLVRRDVKPANMLLDARPGRPDHVYLSDFGISKAAASSAALTQGGQFLGTLDYTAPEQIQGKPVDGRTDQYALACAAFEMLTGQTPFQRDEATAVIWAQMSEPPPSLTSRRPDLAAAADQVFARALAKAPADRYARCADFADALRQALGLAPYHTGPVATGVPDLAAADHPATEFARPADSGVADLGTPTVTMPGQATPRQDTITSPARRRRRGTIIIGAAGAAVLAAGITTLVAVLSHHTGATRLHPNTGAAITARVLSGGKYAFHFDASGGIADDGTHVWVTNGSGNSATELKASDGTWVRTLSGAQYAFSNPTAIAEDRTHVWVVNLGGSSVTELNASDGSWVRTLSAPQYAFSDPAGIADDGTHVWVTNHDNSVTELKASDGSWVRTLSGAQYAFSEPAGIADDGTHVWVSNFDGNSVTELNASDGSWIRTLSGAQYAFNDPTAIADDGLHVWITNQNGHSVTELYAMDGSLARTFSGGHYAFNAPGAVADDGTHVWVTNFDGNSVTELNASDGSWIQTVSGGQYAFNAPAAIADDGAHIWVVNVHGNSVTELIPGTTSAGQSYAA